MTESSVFKTPDQSQQESTVPPTPLKRKLEDDGVGPADSTLSGKGIFDDLDTEVFAAPEHELVVYDIRKQSYNPHKLIVFS